MQGLGSKKQTKEAQGIHHKADQSHIKGADVSKAYMSLNLRMVLAR